MSLTFLAAFTNRGIKKNLTAQEDEAEKGGEGGQTRLPSALVPSVRAAEQ